MQLKRLSTAVLICGASVAGVAATSNAASDPTAEVPTVAQTASLTAAEISLLTTGAPLDVVMDPRTGDLLSVALADVGVTSEISLRSVCDTGDGCYDTNKTPYSNVGFYGSAGTYTGSWPARSKYSSGNYSVSACYAGGCGITIPSNSQLVFASDVTGTSFTIH